MPCVSSVTLLQQHICFQYIITHINGFAGLGCSKGLIQALVTCCWDSFVLYFSFISLLAEPLGAVYSPLCCLSLSSHLFLIALLMFMSHIFATYFSCYRKTLRLLHHRCEVGSVWLTLWIRQTGVSGFLQRNYPSLTVPRFALKCLPLKGKKQERPLPRTLVCPNVCGISILW